LLVALALLLLEALCAVWAVMVYRSGKKHETPAAIGFGLYIYECFHVFGRFFPTVPTWRPPLPLMAAGFLLVLGATALFAWCFWLMKTVGQAENNWENTKNLITIGPYSLVRHPMYGAASLAAAGVALVRITPVGLLLAVSVATLFAWSALMEDDVVAEKFGDAYKVYRRNTKLIFPFLY